MKTLFDAMYTVEAKVDHPDINVSYGYIGYKDNNTWISVDEGKVAIFDNELAAKQSYHSILQRIVREINNRDDELPW